MRIRLYLKDGDTLGLYHGKGKHRVKVADSHFVPQLWDPIYSRDLAAPSDPWYSLNIQKFAILT